MDARQAAVIREVADAIVEAVQAAGPQGVPSGHLYAALMGKLRLDQYEQFIGALVRAGRIKRENHLLTAP